MKSFFAQIFCLVISFSMFAGQKQIDGVWSGKLELGGGRALRLVFHIEDGKPGVSMDSPDQGVKDIPLEVMYYSDDSISCSKPSMMMSFSGKLREDSILGNFFQGGISIPLILGRGENKVNRPQTPVPPFPYTSEEVLIKNDSVSLSGTLTMPETVNRTTPVVLMISGSGLQNRDEEIFEHKPFAVMADYLARRGIASLRYDDRGFGKSEGNVQTATTADFADDAKMALDWLRNTGKFGKIGIIGHSEGGLISFMLGAQKLSDFIISLAGPSISGVQTIAYQNKVALMKSGVDEMTADNFANAIEKAFYYKINNRGNSSIDDGMLAEFYPQYNENALTKRLGETLKQMLQSESTDSWMMYFLEYNPATDMKRLEVPALIIYGEKDKQVPPSLNLAPAKEYVPSATVICYPELNHLMQHAKTGDVEEYSTIEETISPQVLSDITTFIQSQN